MTFVCQCCGDCCSTMGEIISIRERKGSHEFRIQYTDGEERTVTVDPDKRHLFQYPEHEGKKSPACPFLAKQANGKRICTVHQSRPELCRGYLCSRILVLDRGGNKAGRVLYGTRFFSTENRSLRNLWNQRSGDFETTDDEQWEQCVEDLFTRAGYQVIR